MTELFQLSAHKRLWKWLAENPTKKKSEWPEWENNGGTLARASCYCFACEISSNCNEKDDCPLIWPLNRDGTPNCNNGGLWDQWDYIESCYYQDDIENMSDKDKLERTRLALLIMDVPVKEGVECV